MSLLPEPARHRVSGGELSYVALGEGPPVLLIHGFPTSSYLWRREAWLLAQGMRVIVPDLLGYGRSDKPVGADLSEPAQAIYLGELLAELEITELAVVGHDIGGAVAQLLALDHPGLSVRALVLLDSPAFDVWPIEGARMLQAASPEQETAGFVEDVVRLTFDLGVAHRHRLEEATLVAYLEPWQKDPSAFFRAVRGIEGKGLAGRDEDLAALDVPLFLLWGEEDPFLPPEIAERLNELVPGSTLALLPGCSHFVGEDAPTTVGPLIQTFLRTVYLGHRISHAEAESPLVSLDRPSETLIEPEL